MSALELTEPVEHVAIECDIDGCERETRGHTEQALGFTEHGVTVRVEFLLCPAHALAFAMVRDGAL